MRIGAAEGRFPGQVNNRNLALVVHRLPAGPTKVLLNGEQLPQGERAEGSWSYDPEQECTTIRCRAAMGQEQNVMLVISAIIRNWNKR